MGKKQTTSSGVTTNAGLAVDGTTITLKASGTGWVVVLPEKWAGKTAVYNAALKRWVISL